MGLPPRYTPSNEAQKKGTMSNPTPGGPVPLPTAPPTLDPGPTGPATPLSTGPTSWQPEPAAEQKQEGQKAPAKKLFTLNSVVPTVTARVFWPDLYPGMEPWVFTFRTIFSREMEEKRNAYLAQSPQKRREQEDEEILNECADLLAQNPTGFGDWPTESKYGTSPGDLLRAYYDSAKQNPVALAVVRSILIAANNIYWASVTPREYFPPTEDSGA